MKRIKKQEEIFTVFLYNKVKSAEDLCGFLYAFDISLYLECHSHTSGNSSAI
ncbi:hypothetical protein ACFP3I_17090 [Chryseobacterium arachidis]|uniref:hypothetical protein n=1 Tax=Chryseobacterium arachidis TaxID=1416778 RepID=UPI0036072900